MSMLPMDFSFTLQAFGCPEDIEAFERDGGDVDGRWVEIEGIKRTVSGAVVLNVGDKKMEILAEGRAIDSAYTIMFEKGADEFFVADEANGQVQGKQTYVLIEGIEHIIRSIPSTAKNANFCSYYAIRYKDTRNRT